MDALRRRAEAGDAEAMSDLGATYAVGGEGLAQDLAEAMGWFLKSADAGSVLAKLNLAGCYRDGRGCDVDETKAMELYREAASSRPPDPVACDAMECLGEAYRLGECGVQVDDGEAARWFKRGAAAGSVACGYRRGVCLALGVGVAKDVPAAVAAFRNAHESGHAGASLDYGHCLMRGLGVAVDQKAATRAYAVAANKNHPDAAFHLGMAYLQGAGVPRTPRLAAKWLLHAARAGHPEAMHEYAGLVSAGAPPGAPKNVGDAVGWYAAAADAGVAESAAALGSAHFQGIDGFVQRDLGEAEKWFEMALFLGMAEAAGALATARLEKTREAKQTQTLQAHDAAWICFLEKVSALRRVSEMDETTDEDGGGDAPCSRRLHASCVPVPDDKDVVQALKSAEEKHPSGFLFWHRWGDFAKKYDAYFAPEEMERVQARIDTVGSRFPIPTPVQVTPAGVGSKKPRQPPTKPPTQTPPARKPRPPSQPVSASARPVCKPPKVPSEVSLPAKPPPLLIKAPSQGGSGRSKKQVDAVARHPNSPYAAAARRR